MSAPPPPPPGTTTLVADGPPPPPPGPTRSKGPLLVVAVLAVLAVLGVAIVALAGGDDDPPKEQAGRAVDDDGSTTKADRAARAPDDDDAGRNGEKSEERTGAADPSDPQDYGQDATLDKLYDQCKAGDYGACDELYTESGFGTKYEAFGKSCGGRTDTDAYCTQVFDAPASDGAPSGAVSDGLADTSAQTHGDDPDLDAFWDDCAAGDFTACDSLYLSSPFGTTYEEFGRTCGNRNEPQGYCAELYD
jgi:hypothetical protein